MESTRLPEKASICCSHLTGAERFTDAVFACCFAGWMADMRAYVVNARFAAMRMTGAQRAAYETVSRLVHNGEDTNSYLLVSPKSDIEEGLSISIERRGRVRQGHLWEQLDLPRIVRQTGKDAVLYSPMMSGPLAIKRQVLTVHDLFPIDHPEWFSHAYSLWYQWLIPRLLRRVAYVMVSSEYARQRVLDRYGLPEEKVVLCHLAQSERFKPVPDREVAEFRVRYALPKHYLLAIGSLQARKNLTALASAWRRTLARRQGVKLVIAGGSAHKAVSSRLNAGAEALEDPTIYHIGYFPDEHLSLLYQGADAFAFPSLAEGFGLPVLEAMACGTPVICSAATAIPEVAGNAARLVPPLEVEAWVEAIDSVLSNHKLRESMRSAGMRRAANFSWSRTADIVRSVLDSV